MQFSDYITFYYINHNFVLDFILGVTFGTIFNFIK